MTVELVVLGITLALDNFRASIALGVLPFSWGRAVQVAITFGVWDGVAPLLGGFLGQLLGDAIEPFADYVGPAVMGVYGGFLLLQAWRVEEPDEIDHPWALFGIPLSLSVDNLIAGASLGLLDVSPWLAAAFFAAITAVLSFIGLCIGRGVGHLVRIRADLLSGIGLIGMAAVLAVSP